MALGDLREQRVAAARRRRRRAPRALRAARARTRSSGRPRRPGRAGRRRRRRAERQRPGLRAPRASAASRRRAEPQRGSSRRMRRECARRRRGSPQRIVAPEALRVGSARLDARAPRPRLVSRRPARARAAARARRRVRSLALCACGERERQRPLRPRRPRRARPSRARAKPSARAAAPALWVLAEGSQRVLEHPERDPGAARDAPRARRDGSLRAGLPRRARLVRLASRADAAPFQRDARRGGRRPAARAARARARRRAARTRLGQRALALAEPRRRRSPRDSAATPCSSTAAGARCSTIRSYEVPDARPAPTTAWARRGCTSIPRRRASPSGSSRPSRSWSRATPSSTACTSTTSAIPTCCPSRRARASASGSTSATARRRARASASETGLEAPLRRPHRATPTPGTPGAASRSTRWCARSRARRAPRSRSSRSPRPSGATPTAPTSVLAGLARAGSRRAARFRGADGLHARRSPAALPGRGASPGSPLGARIWLGLGSWLFASEPARALRAARASRARPARPRIALFSYDSIAEAPALRDAGAAPASER